MKLRSGKYKMLPSAWTLPVQNRLIAKHTVPLDKARRVMRVVQQQALRGSISAALIPNTLALTLASLRESNDAPALISVDTALVLDRELVPSTVKTRLQGGLVLATLDTWNLHKLNYPAAYLCYLGNMGERPCLRDHRSIPLIEADMRRHVANRIMHAQKDIGNCYD